MTGLPNGSPSEHTTGSVYSALERHGVSGEITDAVMALGRGLVRRATRGIRREWREFAALIDLRSGEVVGPLLSGALEEVDIALQLEAAAGREVISLHTHLQSSSFSPRDVQVFLTHPAIRVLVVLGVDAQWYLMSAQPQGGKDRALAFEIERRFEAEVHRTAGVYRALRSQGLFTKAQAWREQAHEAWARIGADLGLRYDRVKPSGRSTARR